MNNVSRNLYVGNVHPDTESHELKEIFERYGEVERCQVRFGGPTYNVAFGFVSYHSIVHAETAQRSEHGRVHRGRTLVVEFTKTTPGQNLNRNRRTDNREDNDLNQLRRPNRYESYAGYRRSRSSSNSRRTSRHRSPKNDRRRRHDRSRSPHKQRLGSKRHYSSSNDRRRRLSHSSKDNRY
ncbi:unnamed protein product [Adineta ricciae]|uniref:RRM domain-containing protein n=1 Tax=Adineta ricciae TaxID=249248 RepID=A0A815W100_ADIRI|nr:unnamed protein product [Adineta ricciae]CAF1539256.1 unnamed protein product [Adineta ricciae]